MTEIINFPPPEDANNEVEDDELTPAANLLYQAALLIDGERNNQHGNRHESMAGIARLWAAYLGKTISAEDAAIMMALVKVSRMKTGRWNEDDYIDAAGYIALAGEVGAPSD